MTTAATAGVKTSQLPPLRTDKATLEELDKLVEKHGYHSRSELVREAIEDKITQLRGTQIIELRSITDKEAKTEILKHIKGKPSVYPSDVADSLRLPMEQVFRIISELFTQDLVEEA